MQRRASSVQTIDILVLCKTKKEKMRLVLCSVSVVVCLKCFTMYLWVLSPQKDLAKILVKNLTKHLAKICPNILEAIE